MAVLQTGLIWLVYGIVIAILAAISTVVVYMYQTSRDRSKVVTSLCLFTMTTLLATLLLMPVDVALVSSMNSSRNGQRKEWATDLYVQHVTTTLRTIYYTLYSLDTVLCLVIIPFAYFWYEEYDEELTEIGEQTIGGRLFSSLRYTLAFVFLLIIIFLIGFFIPAAKGLGHKEFMDLDYFKRILEQNNGEKALAFVVGLLMTIGTLAYIVYAASGLVFLPVSLIQSAPSISAPVLAATTISQLENNRERQRQLESQNEGRAGGLDARDRRELESLIREERTLVRRERLVAESSDRQRSVAIRVFHKIAAVFRPVKLLFGLLLMMISILTWSSMLITGIDKAKNSICKTRCGYLLGHANLFQPLNWLFTVSSKVFPVDYLLFLFLVIMLFASSITGLATVGIRFLWLTIFRIRKGHTSPQALLIATVILALVILAMNYSFSAIIAPQYSTFGRQTFCDRHLGHTGGVLGCEDHPEAVKQCTELSDNPAATETCIPTVASTIINRIMINYPIFGVVNLWAQFVFLGVYLVVLGVTLIRTPKINETDFDADLEEEEEEGLLASTGRRFNASWQDIRGRTEALPSNYGSTEH